MNHINSFKLHFNCTVSFPCPGSREAKQSGIRLKLKKRKCVLWFHCLTNCTSKILTSARPPCAPSWNGCLGPPCLSPRSLARDAASQKCHTPAGYAAGWRWGPGIFPLHQTLEQISIFVRSLCMSILLFIQSKYGLYNFWRKLILQWNQRQIKYLGL